MKPAPFENIKYTDPKTKIEIRSTLEEPGGNSTEGVTEIFGANGKRLWSMNEFVGRHDTAISPDGKILILSGNFWFGFALNVGGDADIAKVYELGKLKKKIVFSDLFKESAEKIAEDRKLPVMGGGWAGVEDFIKSMDIDWKKRELQFKLYDGSKPVKIF